MSEIGWDGDEKSKLWRYNQNYFNFLNSQVANKNKFINNKIIDHWIRNTKINESVGWEPYPTSLRIVNLVKWFWQQKFFNNSFIKSLYIQTVYLKSNIEWHILGNHLFVNAKALVFAGIFFQGKTAENWTSFGVKIINQQLKEQVLNDGAHFELSTMYHSLFLEDLLDLIYLNNLKKYVDDKTLNNWKSIVIKMLDWLNKMTHPDGDISYFNDSTLGVSHKYIDLKKYAELIGLKTNSNISSLNYLENSGYVRIQNNNLSAYIDIANVGPNYLPGHAHADTLSFECSIYEKRLIVNGGISTYSEGIVRSNERGTANHSTVCINNLNSSHVWKSFRVGKRAKPFNIDILSKNNFQTIQCSHDGYSNIFGKIIHERNWKFNNHSFEIVDKIFGSYDKAISKLILHPNINLIKLSDIKYILKLDEEKQVFLEVEGGEIKVINHMYSLGFNNLVRTNALEINIVNFVCKTTFKWL